MAMFAVAGTVLSVWTALRWGPSWLVGGSGANWLGFSPGWIAAALFLLPAAALLAMAFRPVIEIHETHLRIGRRDIAWSQIRRLDQTGWNVPLAVYLTLQSGDRMLLLYPGDFDSSASLLRHLRRYARHALLDEDEVERMFQRLKTVGHLERRDTDEK